MASLSPEEEAEKAQADFVRSAVRDVRYGPESLSEFTQWRVCSHPTVLRDCSPSSLLAPMPCAALEVSGHEELWGVGRVRKGTTIGWKGPFPTQEAQAPPDWVSEEGMRSPRTVPSFLMAWPHPGADDF